MDQWDAGVLTPAAELRCPACAAAVRPDAPWCTLCYHDLRPAEPAGVVDPAGGANPAYGGSVSEPGYPAYGGSVAEPGYPAYGDSVAEPGYPAYGDSVAEPGYPAYGDSVLDPLTAPVEALGLPGRAGLIGAGGAATGAGGAARAGAGASWPCGACGCANPLDLSACAGCGAGFLAGVREGEGPLLELPLVGDLTVLSRAQRLWLAAGVVLAFITMTVVLVLISN